MSSKLWLITSAVLFLGGASVAVIQIVQAFRTLEAAPSTTDPDHRSMAIGYVLLPIGVALIGLIIGSATLAYIWLHRGARGPA